MRILLVEDNSDHRELMRLALTGHDSTWEVEAAASGEEALGLLLRDEVFDLVFLDYSLPGRDGLDVLKEMRRGEAPLPVVVVTGRGDEQVAVKAMKSGAYDYVVKGDGYLQRLPVVARNALESHQLALKRKQAEKALQESEKEARRLSQENELMAEIGRIIGSTLDIEDVYEHFADKVREVISFDRIAVSTVNMKDNTRTIRYASGDNIYGHHIGNVFPVAGTRAEELIRTRSSMLINSKNIEEIKKKFSPAAQLKDLEMGAQSSMLIPLVSNNEIIGTLAIQSAEKDFFSENDLKLAERVAHQIAGAIANAQLFLDRRQAEEELRLSEENFRLSLVESPLGVRIVTIEGETIYANRAMLNIYGYDSIEELRTTPLKELYTLGSYAEFQIKKERRGKGEYDPFDYEISIVRKNGEVRHLQVFRQEILWNGEKKFQAIYQDITERKQAEENIQASLREKDVLLNEIHHRVKNNLQVISGLLNLQARANKNPDLIESFHEIQNRIQAMSLVHEKLYSVKNFTIINLAGYVRSLSQELFQSYNINPGKIDLTIQIDGEVFVDISKATPCGLMLNELISNALKHAFPHDGSGKLQVIIRETKNREIEIVVRDNGVGLPEDVDIREPRSVGLYLVNGLVKNQLDGQMEVRRDNGTEFRITFPL